MRMPAILLVLGGALWAQPPAPKYEVHRAAQRLVIDGKADEKAWAAAQPVEFIFPWEAQTGAKQKTVARLLWDDDYLYVTYECADTDIVVHYTERDDPTYKDDTVEIFINPKPTQTGIYFGLEMSARAILYDYLMYDSRYAMKRFNMQGVQLATTLRGTVNARGDKDEGWTLEVAIPWVNFEELSKRPEAGTAWTFNMARWDGVEPDRRMSMYLDPGTPRANPHVPAKFGELVFVK